MSFCEPSFVSIHAWFHRISSEWMDVHIVKCVNLQLCDPFDSPIFRIHGTGIFIFTYMDSVDFLDGTVPWIQREGCNWQTMSPLLTMKNKGNLAT